MRHTILVPKETRFELKHYLESLRKGGAFNRTDQGRRKRLSAELQLLLAPHGWVHDDKFIFKRSDAP
jgi:hypothetical protein